MQLKRKLLVTAIAAALFVGGIPTAALANIVVKDVTGKICGVVKDSTQEVLVVVTKC